jgi:hypothetical protein
VEAVGARAQSGHSRLVQPVEIDVVDREVVGPASNKPPTFALQDSLLHILGDSNDQSPVDLASTIPDVGDQRNLYTGDKVISRGGVDDVDVPHFF